MPMQNADDFGTNADGSKSDEYCHFCYQKGSFTDPDMTLRQMIKFVAGFMTKELNMPEFEAREMANTVIPKLKRWREN